MPEMLDSLNLVNALVAFSLAGVFAISWWRYHSHTAMLYWMLTAVCMVVADALLAIRAVLPAFLGTAVPAVIVTGAHLLLWRGIRLFKGRAPFQWQSVAILIFHAVAMVAVFRLNGTVETRMLVNSTVWMFISLLAAQALRGPGRGIWWEGRELPAAVLAGHAIFHFGRVFAVGVLGLRHDSSIVGLIIQFSTIEVSIFMVALFASLLTAGTVRWNRELQEALTQVQTLSGLLPMCASCKSIRDDSGYWNRVEAYISDRSHATFTHSICPACAQKLYPGFFQQDGKAPTSAK